MIIVRFWKGKKPQTRQAMRYHQALGYASNAEDGARVDYVNEHGVELIDTGEEFVPIPIEQQLDEAMLESIKLHREVSIIVDVIPEVWEIRDMVDHDPTRKTINVSRMVECFDPSKQSATVYGWYGGKYTSKDKKWQGFRVRFITPQFREIEE